MQIVLIAGLWLPRTVWTDVATALEIAGHTAHLVALPGVDVLNRSADLGDQITVVVDAVDAAAEHDPDGRVVVVGHSAASALAWMAADRRPNQVRRVVMIGGFPRATGETYAAFFPVVDKVMPFPGWGPFEGPDSVDLTDADKARIERIAVSAPAGVVQSKVRMTDPARYTVPVTVVCPEFSPEDLREWIKAGDLPELGQIGSVDAVDIDSGHWPMITAPQELARILDEVARG